MIKKKKILLCIGNDVGFEVYKFLKKLSFYQLDVISSDRKYLKKNFIRGKKEFTTKLKENNKIYDFMILVYWPYLVPNNIFGYFKDSINFHPSYLPYYRGWYPHVHAKIDKKPYGVTLHKIDKNADTGDIWIQRKIKINFLDSSTIIYNKAKKQILDLFKTNHKKIIFGKLEPKKQKKLLKFYSKEFFKRKDLLNLNNKLKVKEFINLALAREFNKKSFLKFKYRSKKFSLSLHIDEII